MLRIVYLIVSTVDNEFNHIKIHVIMVKVHKRVLLKIYTTTLQSKLR